MTVLERLPAATQPDAFTGATRPDFFHFRAAKLTENEQECVKFCG